MSFREELEDELGALQDKLKVCKTFEKPSVVASIIQKYSEIYRTDRTYELIVQPNNDGSKKPINNQNSYVEKK
ncbi:hypothetical protein B7494_g669 [Chlorociboria aeruginascens]|nr:hypothetical protein B7494_g669 [Chlorociboria aeruginascens]